jgi:hypothetical protein
LDWCFTFDDHFVLASAAAAKSIFKLYLDFFPDRVRNYISVGKHLHTGHRVARVEDLAAHHRMYILE